MTEQDRAVEARRGAIEMRRRAWWDHKYDCRPAKAHEGPLQRCSLYAMWEHLDGETWHLMPYFVTDGHW